MGRRWGERHVARPENALVHDLQLGMTRSGRVIDAPVIRIGHLIELTPVLLDYVKQVGGPEIAGKLEDVWAEYLHIACKVYYVTGPGRRARSRVC